MRLRNRIGTKATLTAVVVLLSTPTFADGIETSFGGFGTVGGTFTSDGRYSYVHNPTEFAGASDSFDVGLESRVAVQLSVSFDPQWSITVQEEAKERGNSAFDPGTEWLYAQYQPTSDSKLRLGRVVLPTFLVSETIDVGYALPWFRAPNEVYGAEPFQYIDGGQALWQHSLGAFQLRLEASYGEAQAAFAFQGNTVSFNSKSTFNAAVSLSWRDLLVRYAETDVNSSLSLPAGSGTLSLQLHDRFHCAGLQYDDGKALLIGEWIKRDEPNLPGQNMPLLRAVAWYAAAGWRFGKFTPLVMYSAIDVTHSIAYHLGNFPTWSGSLRYDVVRNVDLKLQVSRAQADDVAYWIVPNYASSAHVNVYSFGADFVF